MPRKQRFKPSRKPKPPIGTPTDLSIIDVSTLPPLAEPSPMVGPTPRDGDAGGAGASCGARLAGDAPQVRSAVIPAVIDDYGSEAR